ncbi:MAG: leucine-rich repeat domain-containing protein, partial [Clostridiales bacterium]|nr:leucine-rich repeat domain-containing protein [Clostridiales bacterium]
MKRIVSLLLAVMLLISLAACGAPANEPETSTKSLEHIDMPDYGAPVNEPETSTDLPVAPELQETVVFTDPVLETMVRGVIGKPEGSITTADAVAVTRLDLGAEWEQYSSGWTPIKELGGLEYFTSLESLDLSDHAITDISPLAGLSKLTVLALGGNPIANIAPLAGLTNLTVLALPGTGVSNLSPLSGLTRIRHLYLAGCPASDYAPLDGIYANLEGRDFEILPPPTTLAELGFTFNDGDKLALYETSEYDIRLNHGEWGDPPQPDWQNCIRVVTGAETGYKNAVGFYPVHSAYVVWIFNVNTEENYTYVYDVAESSFGCERAVMEPIVREAFGDSDGEDILLTPVAFFDNTIHEALGIAIDTLYNMPFDENIVLASPYEKLGFEFLDYKGTYYYEGYGIELHIHKPEWDKDVEDGH